MEQKINALIASLRAREARIQRTIDDAKEVGSHDYVPILAARLRDFQEIRNDLEKIISSETDKAPE